jgi:hypothetical protein
MEIFMATTIVLRARNLGSNQPFAINNLANGGWRVRNETNTGWIVMTPENTKVLNPAHDPAVHAVDDPVNPMWLSIFDNYEEEFE